MSHWPVVSPNSGRFAVMVRTAECKGIRYLVKLCLTAFCMGFPARVSENTLDSIWFDLTICDYFTASSPADLIWCKDEQEHRTVQRRALENMVAIYTYRLVKRIRFFTSLLVMIIMISSEKYRTQTVSLEYAKEFTPNNICERQLCKELMNKMLSLSFIRII